MCRGARLLPWSLEGMGLGGVKLKSPPREEELTKSIGSCRAWYLSRDDMVLLCCQRGRSGTGEYDELMSCCDIALLSPRPPYAPSSRVPTQTRQISARGRTFPCKESVLGCGMSGTNAPISFGVWYDVPWTQTTTHVKCEASCA